jgi:hypothetical protein
MSTPFVEVEGRPGEVSTHQARERFLISIQRWRSIHVSIERMRPEESEMASSGFEVRLTRVSQWASLDA